MMKSTGKQLPTGHTYPAPTESLPVSFCKYKRTFFPISPFIFEYGMFNVVIPSVYYFEIFNSIVGLVMIFMMDYLRRKKRSANVFFNNKTMFKYIGIFISDANIISRLNYLMRTFFYSSVRIIPAFIRTIFGSTFNSVGPNVKHLKAIKTFNFYHEDIVSC